MYCRSPQFHKAKNATCGEQPIPAAVVSLNGLQVRVVCQGAVTLTVPELLTLMKYQQCLNNTINWSNKVGFGVSICHGSTHVSPHRAACMSGTQEVTRERRQILRTQLVETFSIPAAKVPRQHSAQTLHEWSSELAGSSVLSRCFHENLSCCCEGPTATFRAHSAWSSGVAGSTFCNL
jgi:hypothetical protein